MVKAMLKFYNLKTRTLQRDKAKEVLVISQIQLEDKEKQIDSLKKKMDDIRVKYEILDYSAQTKELYRNYYKGGSNVQTVNAALVNLKAKGGEFEILNEQLAGEIEAYGKLKIEYETSLRDVNKELTYNNNITSPVPADKKSYPIRWLIVLGATVATMILAFIIIYCVENLRAKPNLAKQD
jgi:chromosome segregation ATPase